jgi:hypothetical protein
MSNSDFNDGVELEENGESLSSFGYHEDNEEEIIAPEDDENVVFKDDEVAVGGEVKITVDEGERNKDEVTDEDGVIISKTKIALAERLLRNIQENNEQLINLFKGILTPEEEELVGIGRLEKETLEEETKQVIEGVFDGQNMIGPDGKEYAVPPNYASKSKLVEGDMLKLNITDRGTFVYKQTKPADRNRLIGILEKDDEGNYIVIIDRKKWQVLPASISYFKGLLGDKVVLLVPKSGGRWGAVENIIKIK